MNFQSVLIEEAFPLAYDLYQLDQSPEELAKGFYYTQKMKAQQLWLTQLKSEATGLVNSQRTTGKEKSLLADIQFYEQKVLEANAIQDTAAINRYEDQSLFKSRKAYSDLLRTMEKDYPEYFESKYAFVPQTGERLQKTLAGNELMIEYMLAEGSLYAFTVLKTKPYSSGKSHSTASPTTR